MAPLGDTQQKNMIYNFESSYAKFGPLRIRPSKIELMIKN